ncbi:MAG: 4Fe-4S binding protein [Deltaproteobacteria bacterium]|nr:4Fe-4S binding protein [Deltaproteobacteria bacterium]
MDCIENRILMGNEAIGRGLVEAGCTLATSYPGTPASEVLESVVAFARETGAPVHTEWSVNEKVAYEVALANSYAGKRSSVAMKQVGLNVASDPFMRSAYLGVVGGLVVVVADDPGPHSSQTEQDSRFFSLFAHIPVFDPSTPAEAKDMVERAFSLSEEYELPVMLRPTTRVCHARQNVICRAPRRLSRKASFEKNPARWVATPRYLTKLHGLLNEKVEAIARDKSFLPTRIAGDGSFARRCIIASGVAYANVHDLLREMGVLGRIDCYKVNLPYPLNRDFIETIDQQYDTVMVFEETYPTIECQLAARGVRGRRTKDVPNCGELTPDIIDEVLRKFLGLSPTAKTEPAAPGVRPTLCPGCPHRAAFFAIRETFPDGIFPSDIGCYTLGMNFGAVDTCHCMGACISQGAGFYHAYSADGGAFPTVVVTIGDSTFFHAGIPALVNAVFSGARIIVVILDNGTTAMTGSQPTPQVGIRADGSRGRRVFIADLVSASGVSFLRRCDPYDMETFRHHLIEADGYIRSNDGGVAVIIAEHPCILDRDSMKNQTFYEMTVEDSCVGCRICINTFECPGLVFDEGTKKAVIADGVCIGCGVCSTACPVGAISADSRSESI